MSLRWRLGLIGAAYVLVTVLGGLATLRSAQRWSEALDDRREWLVASEQAARLRASYVDQETGQRGFVITGRDDFLQPYEAGQADAGALVRALEGLQAHDSSPLPISGVETAVVDWRAEAQREIDAVRAGNPQLADALVSAGTTKARFDIVRDRLDRLDAAINVRLEVIRQAVDAGRVTTARSFLITVGMALLVTAVAAYLVRRWLTVPLSSITAAVRRVRAGEDAALTPKGPPELRQVAAAVDDMQRTIRQQRDDAIRAREAIEQSAILALQVRSELTSDLGDYPEGWTMAAGLRPAEGVVAGDCYDVALISPTTIGIVVLDIAGHGAQSAVAALKCKELLKAALRSGLEPGAAISWLSEQEHGLSELFLTAFVAVVDTASGRSTFANAGHPHALLSRGGQLERLGPTGPIVGPFVTTWETASMMVERGAKLIIYTDGLIEARDSERLFYGETRLVDLLLALDCPDAQPVVDRILSDLDDFHPGRLVDDVTIVVACRAPASDGVSEPALSLGTATATAGSPALSPRIDDDVHEPVP